MCVNCVAVADAVERFEFGLSRHPNSSRRMFGDRREAMIDFVMREIGMRLEDRELEQVSSPWDLILLVRSGCVAGHFSPAGGVHCKRRCHFPEHSHRPADSGRPHHSSEWATERVVARYGRLVMPIPA